MAGIMGLPPVLRAPKSPFRPLAHRRGVRPNGLPGALGLALLAACGGASGGAELAAIPAGAGRVKPGGGRYFADEHASGRASRLRLLEITWGRLVDVYGLDASGAVAREPEFRDFVIDEHLRSLAGDYRLETNPVTQETRLVVQRPVDGTDTGPDSFEALVQRAARQQSPILPKDDGPGASPPFSFVARNATLALRFDDLLADSAEDARELARMVRVWTGYPPKTPLEPRIVFDPNHGGVAGGRFHSTRVLVDLTVSVADVSDSTIPLVINPLGLPASDRASFAPNVSLRLPTAVDAGSGQFEVLRNLGGGPIDPDASRPWDRLSPTRDLVRGMRSGNITDVNSGFLLDLEPPRVIGTWPGRIESATPLGPAHTDWRLGFVFTGPCRKAPIRGDVLAIGERFLEITLASPFPDAQGRVELEARVVGVHAPVPEELFGFATFQTVLRGDQGVERACWLRFAPIPGQGTDAHVAPGARVTLRFSEPMDPDRALPFDSLMIVRGDEHTVVTSANLVVGNIRASPDLRELTFVPSLPFAHAGERARYHVRIPRVGGVTDLAGNELADPLPLVEFTIDPNAPRGDQRGFALRFDSADEIEPIGAPDLRGQFTYQPGRGTIRPREAATASRAVEHANPILSLMPSFPPGVATPLVPLGSRLQTVWRYADLGWSIQDESKYNLDVAGLWWSPARDTVSADFFERFEIRVAHSNKLPDEQRGHVTAGLVRYPLSGLWEGPTPFDENVLVDPASPVTVLHSRAGGYRVDPRDLAFTASGTPIMPWPILREGDEPARFTWRDTSVLARAGSDGAGVPMDSEVGPPLHLENRIGSFAVVGRVPAVGLPLLMEFRCYPSDGAIGLNPLAILLAQTISAAPNFRAFSSGGVNTFGQRVARNPDLESVPLGGFNPTSTPPGRPTARSADNAVYVGQLDYNVRISRVHTSWIDLSAAGTRFADVVLEPRPEALPPGTRIEVDYRGADGFLDADLLPFSASSLTAYGDPTTGTILFHREDPLWKQALGELDGSRYLQLRFTFVNNLVGGLVAELSAVGVAYTLE